MSDVCKTPDFSLMRTILADGFERLGIEPPETAATDFYRYYRFLSERARVMNLTAISGAANVARLHFLDCGGLLAYWDFTGDSVIDIGSGAGFPGIPLKILCPGIRLTLLDSQRKRVDFMAEAAEMLGLGAVSCIHARAEEAAKPVTAHGTSQADGTVPAVNLRESFGIAVSRAVASLDVLCELCMPFVRPGGVFIAMKGPDCSDELEAAQSAITLLGGSKPRAEIYPIPGTDIFHSAVIIEKLRPTPLEYPRRFNRIQKSPL